MDMQTLSSSLLNTLQVISLLSCECFLIVVSASSQVVSISSHATSSNEQLLCGCLLPCLTVVEGLRALLLPACLAVIIKHLHRQLLQLVKQLLGQASLQQHPLPCLSEGQP